MATHGLWMFQAIPPTFVIRHAFEARSDVSLCGKKNRTVGEWRKASAGRVYCHECKRVLTGPHPGEPGDWVSAVDRALKKRDASDFVIGFNWDLEEAMSGLRAVIPTVGAERQEVAFQILGMLDIEQERRNAK